MSSPASLSFPAALMVLCACSAAPGPGDGGAPVDAGPCGAAARMCEGECLPLDQCCSHEDCDRSATEQCNASTRRCEITACNGPPSSCSSFVEGGGQTTIAFGGAAGLAYSPRCLRIRPGASVTFTGNFAAHPLAVVCQSSSVLTRLAEGTSRTFTFDTPGDYRYRCEIHGGAGMTGVIRVEP